MKPHFPCITCKNGVRLSVQASQYAYCTPRQDKGPYTDVEVGFPSQRPPESWKEYCEDWDNPTGSIFAYIPVSLIEAWILENGGIDLGLTL